MEEDYDMEERHMEVDHERELRPDLWQTLPHDLIDCIMHKLLEDLPFSRIFRFCCIFKQWTDLLLSTHYILFLPRFLHMGKCMLFNPKRGVWESISLQFCAAEGLRLQALQQVSCRKGLLLLSSAANDEIIVCNPLTKRCTRVRRPAGPQFYDAASGARNTADTTWRVAFKNVKYGRQSSVSSSYFVAINVVIYSDAGHFYLIVGQDYTDSKSVLAVKDSRCGRFETISDAPKDFCFFVQPTMFSKVCIFLGFCASPGGFKVLTYDVLQKRSAWISGIQTMRCIPNATPSGGKVLIATIKGDQELEFLDMRNAEPTTTFATSPFPPPRKVPRSTEISEVQPQNIAATSHETVPDSSEVFNIVRLADGAIVHYICTLTRSGQVETSVWTCNRMSGSDRISDWEEWQLPGLEAGQLQSARQFYIFKPSFLSPG